MVLLVGFFSLMMAIVLTSCGQTGNLYLPPHDQMKHSDHSVATKPQAQRNSHQR